ncbi:MAG: hypoxanthine phosphoribosyltransferase [Oscillospiraceae bacterium]
MHGDVLKVLLSEEELSQKVKEMGARISADYEGRVPVIISVLKGSVVFVSDLIRAIDVELEIDFMVVSSYENGTVSSGAVQVIKDVGTSLEGRDVLIVEDILDSGITLSYLKELMEVREPASLRIATLLDKPSRRKSDIVPDYVGFTIPDEFVIGYGLDYAERYRNLPYIGVLKPSVYAEPIG